uniref:hypothetical protein n=1 Tax=Roseivirga sp. TaxID=1964215 RepID=UPI0040474A3B
MISINLNDFAFELPTSHKELGKKHLLKLMKHLLFNDNSLTAKMQFVVSQLKIKRVRGFKKKAEWLQAQGLDDFQWESILDECDPLFGPIRELPFNRLRLGFKSYYFCMPYLDNLAFGQWCILNESLNAFNFQENPKEAMHHLEVIGEIVLDKKCPKATWFIALVIRYAQGSVMNVIDMPAYAAFFKGSKSDAEAPAFGWYSLANGLAKDGVFGPLEKLKASPLHEVLMHLTEQAIEHKRNSIRKKLEG